MLTTNFTGCVMGLVAENWGWLPISSAAMGKNLACTADFRPSNWSLTMSFLKWDTAGIFLGLLLLPTD